MSVLTASLLACLSVFLGGWFLGSWKGNFSLLLFILTSVTLVYWLLEQFMFAPRRHRAAEEALRQWEAVQGNKALADLNPAARAAAVQRHLEQPWWLDWTAGLFPVILVVFLLRSFLFEPFKIPTGSMIPTLLVGDLILVNKYHYGIRLPVINKKVIPVNDPQRGDVIVFRFPLDTSMDYIKRVVGLPGDEVTYKNQTLSINGEPVDIKALDKFYDEDSLRYFRQFEELLGAANHRILVEPTAPASYASNAQFPYHENCFYVINGLTCIVPKGHYFVMGDNRDNSQDSRYWGFVPDENIVGKAFFVWMNFGNIKRIGPFH